MVNTTEKPRKARPAASVPANRPPEPFAIQWRNPERDLVDYAGALWAHKLAVLLVTLGCGLVGLVWALRKPNTYASRATLMVHGPGTVGSTADAAANLLSGSPILPDQVMTAVDIVRSRVVLERVVEKLGYKEILRPYEPLRVDAADDLLDRVIDTMHEVQARWLAPKGMDFSQFDEATLRAAAVDTLDLNLSVLPATRGTTIGLSYLHTSPTGAQQILAAVVEESIRRYGEVVAPPEGREWLATKVEQAAAEEEAARQALEAFVHDHGTTDLSQEISALTESLVKLTGNLRLAKMQLKESEQVLDKLRQEIKGVEPNLREVVQEVFTSDPVREVAQQKLLELRVMRAGEDDGTAAPSPLLRKLNNQIHTLKDELKSLGSAPPDRTVAVRPNPKHATLEDGIRQREIALIGLRTQIPVFEETIVEARRALEQRRELQRQVTELKQHASETEATHKRLLEISKTYEINDELDVHGLAHLRLVEPASEPRTKEGPRRGRLLLGALAGGFLMMVTWTLLRVRLSRRLVRHKDVEFALGRSDIVGMPRLTSRGLQRFEQARKRGWQ